ncbi:MAG: tetratricopeptide repeat protein [Nitrospirota bacterium]
MRGIVASVLVLTLLFIAAPAVNAAEEELFDTKAAAAGIEEGISLIKKKQYDAAVEKFEDAAAMSPDIEAEALYYAGYASYLKGRAGDEDARQRSVEFFERAYEINPNFSPNKFKPTEPVPGSIPQQGGQGGDVTPATAAPAGTLAVPPVQQTPAAPAAPPAPAAPAEQPKQ